MPFKKGYIPWNKGKKGISEEYRRKLSKAKKGKPSSMEGKKQSEKWRITMKKTHQGRKCSEDTKRKMREAQKGEKSHLWKGGISYEIYPVDWTKTLKRSIRERDKYTCRVCREEPAIYVHHIDYDKKNCNSDNLITLCSKCHSKTNFNRKHWINYFKIITE